MPNENSLGVFNLLFPEKNKSSKPSLVLELGGYYLKLKKQSKFSSFTEHSYTCISYSWNTEREPNFFHEKEYMSQRTLSVLSTAIGALKKREGSSLKANSDSPLWIDSFCVPPSGAEKEECLRNMGTVYGNATQVLVVLSPSTSALLQEIRDNDKINIDTLLLLEKDDWAMRAWTYQEIVNSKAIFFIAEGEIEAPVAGYDFFDAVVKARKDLQEENGYDMLKMDSLYPNLGNLESVILDWRMSEYQSRSAYQVMASIETRKATQPKELIYAMIGAIAAQPTLDKRLASVSPEEYFMKICEEKKDFSFIYTNGKRSDIRGKCWRPNGEQLKVVLPNIVCTGDGQKGVLCSTHLQLDNVNFMSPSRTSEEKLKGLIDFYKIGNGDTPRSQWSQVIFEWLRKAGFSGCGQCIEFEQGFFFPIEPVSSYNGISAIISTGIRFLIGAPGLLVKDTGTSIYHTCEVGVFFGRLSLENAVSINVGI